MGKMKEKFMEERQALEQLDPGMIENLIEKDVKETKGERTIWVLQTRLDYHDGLDDVSLYYSKEDALKSLRDLCETWIEEFEEWDEYQGIKLDSISDQDLVDLYYEKNKYSASYLIAEIHINKPGLK